MEINHCYYHDDHDDHDDHNNNNNNNNNSNNNNNNRNNYNGTIVSGFRSFDSKVFIDFKINTKKSSYRCQNTESNVHSPKQSI